MAQLKDTLITGDLNVTEDAHAAKFYTKILMARQSDSSNTLSAGTAGYVLTSGGNATDVYWSEPLSLGNDSLHAAAGNHNHTTSIATSSGTNQLSLQSNTKYVLNAGGTSYIFTTPVDTTYVFDGTYNSSSNKAATVSTVTGAINNLTGIITGEPGSVKTVTSFSQTDGIVAIGFGNIAFPVTKVNGKTGDVNITASDLGLSKALKFIGVSSSIISDEGNQTPTINNSTITPTTGDVVMYNSLEYFWDGSKWNELGDANSFALASHNHNISDILDFPSISNNNGKYLYTNGSTVTWVNKPSYTYSEVGAASTSHTHGYITNSGELTTNGTTLDKGKILCSNTSTGKIEGATANDLGLATTADLPGDATSTTSGLMTADQFSKLAGIAAGAEVNQNAFSTIKIKVGQTSTDLIADTKTDTLTIEAGDNISFEPTANSDTFIITATDTIYTLPYAQNDVLGGIKTGYSSNGTNYAVALDSNNKAYVNVPNKSAYKIIAIKPTAASSAINKSATSAEDTFTIIAGTNVEIDTNTDKQITISTTDTDTTNTAGSTSSTSALYIIGATEQSASLQTYSVANTQIQYNSTRHALDFFIS